MKLGIAERINLFSILPEQGDFTTMKALSKARDGILLSEDEVKKYGVEVLPTETGSRTIWKKDEEVEIELGELVTAAIVEKLKQLSDQKKLTAQHISLYEKFVEAK